MAMSKVTRVSLTLNVLVLVLGMVMWSQRGAVITSFLHTHVERKLSFFDQYASTAGDVVFLGDSITEAGLWSEMFPGVAVRNRGIGGDTTTGVLQRLHQVTGGKPRVVFLKIGTNDLTREPVDRNVSYQQYALIVHRIQQESPGTTIVVQSLLPRAAQFRAEVEAFNREIQKIAEQADVTYLDLYSHFLAEDGSIRDELSNDELHLLGSGYALWQTLLLPLVQVQ